MAEPRQTLACIANEMEEALGMVKSHVEYLGALEAEGPTATLRREGRYEAFAQIGRWIEAQGMQAMAPAPSDQEAADA